MKLLLFKTLWGHDGSLLEAIDQAAAAGFDGIEGPVPEDEETRAEVQDYLAANDQELIAEVCTGGSYVPSPHATVQEHLDDLRRGVEHSLHMNHRFINTMCGLDAWPMPVQVQYFEQLLAIEQEFHTNITVETHRSRSTFNPWRTRELATILPRLKLNLDFSHWCCISERLVMNDDPELLAFFGDQAWHMHGRVGYDQGPQVPDPRAPEYAAAVDAHCSWWRTVWTHQYQRGFRTFTMTPEFGPDGYLHLEPYTQKPVADLWEVNQWMGQRLREEFADWSAGI